MNLSLAALTLVLALPVAASASEYFPNQPTDAYRYRDDAGLESSAEVLAATSVGHIWTNFAGMGSAVVWTPLASEEVYLWTGYGFQFVANLGRPVGTTSHFDVGCATGATIVDRGATVIVPAGTFYDTVTLQVDSSCDDAGVETLVFARGIGPVLYTTRTPDGVTTHELFWTSRLRANPWMMFALSPVGAVAAQAADTSPAGPYAGAGATRHSRGELDSAP